MAGAGCVSHARANLLRAATRSASAAVHVVSVAEVKNPAADGPAAAAEPTTAAEPAVATSPAAGAAPPSIPAATAAGGAAPATAPAALDAPGALDALSQVTHDVRRRPRLFLPNAWRLPSYLWGEPGAVVSTCMQGGASPPALALVHGGRLEPVEAHDAAEAMRDGVPLEERDRERVGCRSARFVNDRDRRAQVRSARGLG